MLDVPRDAFAESNESETLLSIEHMLFGVRRNRGETMKQWIAKANYAYRQAEQKGAALPAVYIALCYSAEAV